MNDGPDEEITLRVATASCTACGGPYESVVFDVAGEPPDEPLADRCPDCHNAAAIELGLLRTPAPWHPLVHEAYARMRAVDPGVRIMQIKEKYGSLRVYHDPGEVTRIVAEDEPTMAALRAIEDEILERSTAICEACGAPGEPAGPHWSVHTACPAHAEPQA